MRRSIIVNAGITKEQLFIFKELYIRRETWISIRVVGAIEGEEKNIVIIDFPETELEYLIATLDLMEFKEENKDFELLTLN